MDGSQGVALRPLDSSNLSDPRREAAKRVAELIELTLVEFYVRVSKHLNPLVSECLLLMVLRLALNIFGNN